MAKHAVVSSPTIDVNKDQLWRHVQKAWDDIPMEKVNGLIDSKPRRRDTLTRHKYLSTGF